MKYLDLTNLFHQATKALAPVPGDPSVWPETWKTTYYKSYERFETIPLGESTFEAQLKDAIVQRQSRRITSSVPITKSALSSLLQYSCGIVENHADGRPRRAQPSGGGRYPIEMYPIILKEGELPTGLYHYNVLEHGLDVLWKRPFSKDDIHSLIPKSEGWVENASCIIVMTCVFNRSQMKYQNRGYRYALLESGHIGQNMYLVSEALNLHACAFGGTDDALLEKCIDIDGVTESIVHVMIVSQESIVPC
jgi:SagB-type dehydrogenase family enzyme